MDVANRSDLTAALDVGTQLGGLLRQANEENVALRIERAQMRGALDRLKRVGTRLLRERNRTPGPWLAMLESARAEIEQLRVENSRLRARLAGTTPL